MTLAFEHFIEAFETIVFEQLRPSPLKCLRIPSGAP